MFDTLEEIEAAMTPQGRAIYKLAQDASAGLVAEKLRLDHLKSTGASADEIAECEAAMAKHQADRDAATAALKAANPFNQGEVQ